MRKRWVEYVAHNREKRSALRAGTDHLEKLGIPWRIVIK
jgi:hypothetical protein